MMNRSITIKFKTYEGVIYPARLGLGIMARIPEKHDIKVNTGVYDSFRDAVMGLVAFNPHAGVGCHNGNPRWL